MHPAVPLRNLVSCRAPHAGVMENRCFVLVQKKVTALHRFYRRFFTVQNVLLGVGWLAWLALLIFVQAQTADLAPFDPYEILRVRKHPYACIPHIISHIF